MELVRLEALGDSTDQALEARHDPAVHFIHFLRFNGIGGRVEVVDITEEIPVSIADTPVHFDKIVDDALGDPDIVPVIRGRDPEPQDIRPVFLDDFLGADSVAQGF